MRPYAIRRRHADTLGTEIFRFLNDIFGNDAVFDTQLFVVEVIDKAVQGGKTLLEAGFGYRPVLGINGAGNNIEWPDPVDIAFIGIHRETDAHFLNCRLRRQTTLFQFVRRQ